MYVSPHDVQPAAVGVTTGDPHFTLDGTGSACVFDGQDIRHMMPVECERLMGFPDGWTASLSDHRRYVALGESVMVPVIEHIGRQLV